MTVSRRRFVQSALGTSLAVAVGTGTASAIDPVHRTDKPHIRLSLAAYSFRGALAAKPRPTMTLEQFVELAAGLDLDAVEPTSYYFPETSPEYLAKLKGLCTRLGLDVSGTPVRNDFCEADAEARKKHMDHVKQWIEHASRLGAKTVRIFAGKIAKGETEEKARSRCVEAIQEACDHAGKYGIYLAMENHGGITSTAEQVLAIVKAVKHDWFGVNLDTGNFHSADPYAELAQIAPYAVVVQVKTEIQRKGQKEDADLGKLIEMLRKANYRGYVTLEYEGMEDAKVAVPRHIAALKKLLA